ncbi:MAG: nucleoside hydrolase-like domain-containing protein, partial [Candidatus Aminicenantales bacterium]
MHRWPHLLISSLIVLGSAGTARAGFQDKGALSGERHRVIVSTDLGGEDPDDYQSMIHYLLYADLFDTEGIVSSPSGSWGTTRDIHGVLDHYERDYKSLRSRSKTYPTPDALRAITKQGADRLAPGRGYRTPTEGSKWIIECAHRPDNRPLYILAWASLEDVGQALHDDPSILDKIRVYYIGGPNKKFGGDSYDYIEQNFPNLWMVENNSTYRGWYYGGVDDHRLRNENFFNFHLKGHGALGDLYGQNRYGGSIKMGDTPSVSYMLYGNPADPENGGWGGRFRRVAVRPKTVFHGDTTLKDKVEVFGIVELVLNGPDMGPARDEPQFSLIISNQEFHGFYYGNGVYKWRWAPKAVAEWSY